MKYEKILISDFHRGNEEFRATMDRSSVPILFLALLSNSSHVLTCGRHIRPHLTVVDHRSLVRNKFTSYHLYFSGSRLVCQQEVRLTKNNKSEKFYSILYPYWRSVIVDTIGTGRII